MLLAVTPNLCIERTIQVPEFSAGCVHRVAPSQLKVNVGGKGINAARVAGRFGCAAHALSWAGRRQKGWLEDELKRENIAHDLVETESDTRVCTNILAGDDFVKTEIVEAGNSLSVDDGTRLLERYAALLPKAQMVAICGSYPPCENPAMDLHLALLVQIARQAGKRVLVDGKGPAFHKCLLSKSPPWCVKPNLDEAQELLNRLIETPQDERRAVRDILKRGVEIVILSCGARGAYFGTRQNIWFAEAPRVRKVSEVGSGDSLVGAFCAMFLETADLLLAARWGVAAGAANAMQIQSAFVGKSESELLLNDVKITAQEWTLASQN